MTKIGKTTFGDHVKDWPLDRFVECYDKNVGFKKDMARYGYTLENVWELLTGKSAKAEKKPKPKPKKKDAVPEVSNEDTKD
jgi:hypothetical protein